MTDTIDKKASPVLFLTFNGDYGGDKYEQWLFERLSMQVPLTKVSEDRLGGLRTIKSLIRMMLRGYNPYARRVVRPFGIPVFRPNMVVVFHHFDHTGVPWYSRVIETVDMLGLKITAKLFGTRFLVVSQYWGEWLQKKGFNVEYLVYNQLSIERESRDSETRRYLSEKYRLDFRAKWVFLGGDQWKKGGRAVLDKWRAGNNPGQGFQFIFSGKRRSDNECDDSRVIWLEEQDYSKFLSQLHAVVANSLFDEGWCRVVHEAILTDIPVAGSGRGGMAELLTMGGYSPRFTESEMIDFIANPCRPVDSRASSVELIIEKNNDYQIGAIVSYLQSAVRRIQ